MLKMEEETEGMVEGERRRVCSGGGGGGGGI